MPITLQAGDELFDLPGDWPPCESCRSVLRSALATLRHRNIGFVCGDAQHLGERHNDFWIEDNGSSGLWIRHHNFLAGGCFEGILPSRFISTAKAKSLDTRYAINERRADYVRNEQDVCAVCNIPPMRESHDQLAVWAWLEEHHPSVHDDVIKGLSTVGVAAPNENWMRTLDRVDPVTGALVGRTIHDSHLQADHGIPRATLKALWPRWDRAMRLVATNTLAHGVCRPDNNGKGKRLPSSQELLARHVRFNHDGNFEDARIAPQWRAIRRVLESIDALRAVDDA